LPIEFVVRNPNNPRRDFAEEDLADLAASIREHGIIQPVVVRPQPGKAGMYELIAGERRWRAAQRAGLVDVPVIVRDVDDKVALELAIIENVQRADLNPIEEAAGYQKLMDEYDYTQADLGEVIGKSRSHVANTLRLLKLPVSVQSMVSDGALSAGHARALITATDPEALAQRIVGEGLSVRQAETLAQPAEGPSTKKSTRPAPAEKDADTLALEKLLTDQLGLRVEITHGNSGGEVRVKYRTLDQLDSLCHRLQGV
jgi:ParB family chromosome partitioning protein